jgi:hydroxymethylpyrimidine/phosphomethylpyrimidine kinase
MLATTETIVVVAEALQSHKVKTVILDPVGRDRNVASLL